MNEIVKYQNDMNRLSFKGFNQMDMNVFVALCSQLKEKDTTEITLSFSKIKELIGYERKSTILEFISELKRMNRKLMSVNCEIITGSKIIMFVLFPTFTIDDKAETLTVAVNKDFTWLLNEMKNYTTFELAEFIDLKSKYAKNLYRILKQWRTQGRYVFHDLEEFRELMDVPKTYTNRQLMQDCVSVAIREISELDTSFKGFKCTPVYARKRGKPLDKLEFTWQCEESKQIEGQSGFTDVESFDKYMDEFQKTVEQPAEQEEPPSAVAIKIAKDIEKGRKKKSKEPKTNKFNNFDQRTYSKRYYELLEKQMQIGLTDEEQAELDEEQRKARN